MNRHLAIGLILCAVVSGTAGAEEPVPPWQRLLTGDDARKAAELGKRIADLEAADNYAEAIRLSEEMLALRTRIQGADHWKTVNVQWELMLRKKVVDLPAEKRNSLRNGNVTSEEAKRLEQKSLYPQAFKLRQEWLKWCQETLGEDQPFTAVAYNNVAFNLQAQAKYAEAASLFQKALVINRQTLGEDNPHTATSYNNVGYILNRLGKHAEAGDLFQKALAINRWCLGEDHLQTATSYNNVAGNLQAQGQYAKAEPLFQKALDIRRKTLGEDNPDTAQSYSILASNLQGQGKHAEAGPLLQKALTIFRQTLGENHPFMAQIYNNIAYNLQAQGRFAEAGQLYQKALAIWRQTLGEDHPNTAGAYNNVASNLDDQRLHAEAAPLYQKALDIRRKVLGEEHPDTATSYNNIAFNLNAQRKYAEAQPLFEKVLAIRRKVLGEEHPLTAGSYQNIGANLNNQGKSAEAEPFYQKALALHRKILGENHPATVGCYRGVAYNSYAQEKYADALAAAEAAARSYEAARLNMGVRGLDRASYGANNSPYAFLAIVHARDGRAAEAWAAQEANLARGVLEELAGRRDGGLSPDERKQQDEMLLRRAQLEARLFPLLRQAQRSDAEAAELEKLLGQRQQLEQALADLAVRVSRRELATLAQLQAALPPNGAMIVWVDATSWSGRLEDHWGCVVRSEGVPHWERLPGSGPGAAWTRADTELPQQFRTALDQSAPAAEVVVLAQKLHDQRLAPLSKHLTGVQQLFVAPVQVMAGIPIEALTDQYTVTYVPSGTYLAHLQERPRPRSTGLLAIGDPRFPPIKETPVVLPPGGLLIVQVLPDGPAAKARLQAGDVLVAFAGEELTSIEQLNKLIAARAGDKTVVVKVWREGQEQLAERELPNGRLGLLLAKEPARQAITARREAERLQRGEQYAELPGTQVEIARLAELFGPDRITTLTRAEATEQRLDELRRAGRLKEFRYLHFATHGKANAALEFESALLLTPPERLPEARAGEPYLDGRLTAAEVLRYWQLDAELVTLSACESGLGKRGGGDGSLGFAQAFLLSGSRSVCLSLWQVDDTATAIFMDRFYRNLLGKRSDGAKPMSKAAALREAKEWLRTLPASEALERLGTLTQGVVRGERPAREEMRAVPVPKDAPKEYRPYAHPRYWAAFILMGDPE